MTLATAAFVFSVAFLIHSVGRRILGLGLEGDGVVERTTDRQGHWLLLRPSKKQLERVLGRLNASAVLDADSSALKPENFPQRGPIVVGRVDRMLDDRVWTERLRQVLVSTVDRRLVLVSAIDPLHFFVARARESRNNEVAREVADWAAALAGSAKIRFTIEAPAGETKNRFERRIRRECRWNDQLREIEAEVRKLALDNGLGWREITELVLDMSEPFYRTMWDLCSVEEKLVLRQLADEGVVNPRCSDVLYRLRRRRLIRVDPRFQIVNESFREFVRQAESDATVAEWERPDGEQHSRQVRGPIFALTVLAAVLLAATQGREAFALVSAGLGAIPLLKTLADTVRGSGSAA